MDTREANKDTVLELIYDLRNARSYTDVHDIVLEYSESFLPPVGTGYFRGWHIGASKWCEFDIKTFPITKLHEYLHIAPSIGIQDIHGKRIYANHIVEIPVRRVSSSQSSWGNSKNKHHGKYLMAASIVRHAKFPSYNPHISPTLRAKLEAPMGNEKSSQNVWDGREWAEYFEFTGRFWEVEKGNRIFAKIIGDRPFDDNLLTTHYRRLPKDSKEY